MSESANNPSSDKASLGKPGNIRRLWLIFVLTLAASVLAQFAVDMHPHFELDGWFGFNAAFGFLSCVAMVLFAKVLGFLLKRKDDYYQQDAASSESNSDV